MPMDQGFYDGRRGHKRLKAMEKQIEKLSSEFQTPYEGTAEMHYLQEELQWEGPSKLIFIMALRNVHFTWNGVRDYGFIRLCKKWVEENRVTVLSAKAAAAMIRSILPAQMCEELGEELSAMQIY